MPMDSSKIDILIAKLFTKTAQKRADQITLDMAIEFYLEDLEKYPADILQDAVQTWIKNNKWWPTMFDLTEQMDWRTDQRRAILEGLRKPPMMYVEHETPERESQESREATVKAVFEKLNIGGNAKTEKDK